MSVRADERAGGAPAVTPEQQDAVDAFAVARQAMRDAMWAHTVAWRKCRDVGLEHRGDASGQSRWPEAQGDWRRAERAGRPILPSASLPARAAATEDEA